MKIYCWNVNGIRAVAKKGFLDWFKESDGDMICLQETKAFPDQLEDNLKHPDGYHAYWHNGTMKGYAGVVTYAKQKALNVRYAFGQSVEMFSHDGRIVETTFSDFTLVNIYFPNGNPRSNGTEVLSHKLKFYEYFLSYMDQLKSEGKSIIACGDFNIVHTEIDIARPKENENSIGYTPVERAWISKVIDHGYLDVFRHLNPDARDHYTWWSYRTKARERNIGWRIDYFFITPDLKDQVRGVGHQTDVMGSDHCPLFLELDIK